jgi:hypothetical protein
MPLWRPNAFLGTQICLSGTPSAFMAKKCLYGAPMPSQRPNLP